MVGWLNERIKVFLKRVMMKFLVWFRKNIIMVQMRQKAIGAFGKHGWLWRNMTWYEFLHLIIKKLLLLSALANESKKFLDYVNVLKSLEGKLGSLKILS